MKWMIMAIVLAALTAISITLLGRRNKLSIMPYKDLTAFIKKQSSDDSEDIDPEVVEYQRKQLEQLRQELGSTIDEILEKEASAGTERVFDAIHLLCSWKYTHGNELTATERFVLAIFGIQAEVNNGGFHQYFFNSAGDDWKYLLNGMQDAGDLKGVERFESVLSKFSEGRPSEKREERWSQLDEFGEDYQYEVFDSDDNEYFETPFPDFVKAWALIRKSRNNIQPIPW